MTAAPDYIGDAVYIHIDERGSVVLTTEHHEPAKAGNVIHLEAEVVAAMLRYLRRHKYINLDGEVAP